MRYFLYFSPKDSQFFINEVGATIQTHENENSFQRIGSSDDLGFLKAFCLQYFLNGTKTPLEYFSLYQKAHEKIVLRLNTDFGLPTKKEVYLALFFTQQTGPGSEPSIAVEVFETWQARAASIDAWRLVVRPNSKEVDGVFYNAGTSYWVETRENKLR